MVAERLKEIQLMSTRQ